MLLRTPINGRNVPTSSGDTDVVPPQVVVLRPQLVPNESPDSAVDRWKSTGITIGFDAALHMKGVDPDALSVLSAR